MSEILKPRNREQVKCRHPMRLWKLSADRKYVLCGGCDLRVGRVEAWR